MNDCPLMTILSRNLLNPVGNLACYFRLMLLLVPNVPFYLESLQHAYMGVEFVPGLLFAYFWLVLLLVGSLACYFCLIIK